MRGQALEALQATVLRSACSPIEVGLLDCRQSETRLISSADQRQSLKEQAQLTPTYGHGEVRLLGENAGLSGDTRDRPSEEGYGPGKAAGWNCYIGPSLCSLQAATPNQHRDKPAKAVHLHVAMLPALLLQK